MASDSGSSFIKRNRAPRVHIAYADPYQSDEMVELPFVMGVMSDLSGNNPRAEKPDMPDRDFEDVTKDTIDGMMKTKIKPGMTFMVENKIDESSSQKLGVNLQFDSMKDFEPAQIARQVPAMRKLLEAREHLANLQRYMSARPKAQEQIKQLLNDPELLAVMAAQVEQKEAARDAQDDSEE